MFKTITFILIFIIAVAAFTWLAAPKIIEKNTNAIISQFQFEDFAYENINASINGISYEKIAFDGDDKLNIIPALSIKYSPLSLLRKQPKSIEINHLEIMGSIADDNEVFIDGIQIQPLLPAILASNAERIEINGFDVSIFVKHYGALTATGDIIATRNAQGAYDIAGTINSRQRFVSVTGNLTGTLSDDVFTLSLEILNGKIGIQSHSTRLSRMSGTATVTIAPSGTTINSNLVAGGFRIGKLQWQNASINATYENQETTAQVSAKAVRLDDVELALTYKDKQTFGTVYTGTPENTEKFYQQNGIKKDDPIVKMLVDNLYFIETENGLSFKNVPRPDEVYQP